VVVWRGDELLERCREAATNKLEQGIRETVMSEADENCPVEWGALRGSHYVKRLQKKIKAGYGGASAPYAAVQHKRLDFKHKVGKARWMADAFENHREELAGMAQEGIDEALSRP